MARVKKNLAFQKYIELEKDDIQLPSYTVNSGGYIEPFIGEVYCRAQGCDVETQFRSLNNLKKHIRKKHGQQYNLLDGEAGGRPNRAQENEAITFYEGVITAYDTRKAAEEPVLPPLPRRRDGKVHIIEMRKAVRGMGHVIPCKTCKAQNKGKICCHEGTMDTCEHFGLFDHGEESSEEIEEENSEEDGENEDEN